MTVTDEMRFAFRCRATGYQHWEIDEIYLAMRALDPEIVALRNDESNGRTYRAAVDYYDPLLHDCETELATLRSTLALITAERDHFEAVKDSHEAEAQELRDDHTMNTVLLRRREELVDKLKAELATLRPVVEAADEHEKASSDDGVMLSRVHELESILHAGVRAWREGLQDPDR
jgi:hypothetical protein